MHRKIFILDTSVLLYDKNSIHSFKNNDVVLPIVVLDELDRKKEAPGILGESARYVNRFLDGLRSQGSLTEGVTLSNNQTIKVEMDGFNNVPQGLSKEVPDNKIISCALYTKTEKINQEVVVVTKDINFRVKCDALGIKAEDYEKDRIVATQDEIYKGYVDVKTDDQTIIDKL